MIMISWAGIWLNARTFTEKEKQQKLEEVSRCNFEIHHDSTDVDFIVHEVHVRDSEYVNANMVYWNCNPYFWKEKTTTKTSYVILH